LLGYGLSGDASHITAGRQDGAGALLAIRGAFRNFLKNERRLDEYRNQLWCVNAHATSTPLGDAAELTAIQKFVRELKDINFGHLVRLFAHSKTYHHLFKAPLLLQNSRKFSQKILFIHAMLELFELAF